MRILFVALTLPFPPTNGHCLRTWAILQALAREGHELTLMVLAEDEASVPPDSPLRSLCRRVEVMRAPRPKGVADYARRVRAVLSPLPYGVWRLRSPRLRRRVADELGRRRHDALLCDGAYTMINLPESPGLPVLLNKDDVAHVILQRYVGVERHPARRLYGWLEGRKVRAWEQLACARATTVLASSEVDRLALEAMCPGMPIVVVPNAVDTESYRPVAEEGRSLVLYQGGMDWYPNRDAVEFFAFKVLPELRRLAPAVVFRVAGRPPSAGFRRRFAIVEAMEFSGHVEDMRDEIARASVCVVPLRIGSGTRLKILEAGAMGKAIVSTHLGAEGLELVNGEEILLADDPKGFAGLVAGLLGDGARRAELGLAARRRVERWHAPHVLRSAVRTALARSTS